MNANNDFYEQICCEFNNSSFVPMSRSLPDLHEDFADSVELPLSEDMVMSPNRAKSLIASMKPEIAKIMKKL